MQWLKPKQSSGIPEINSVAECQQLLGRDFVIFFKHSPTCPVSWMAHREVTKFLAGQPQAPVYLVSVRNRRDVAQFLTQATSIEHESPQVIVLRNGQVTGNASHDDVTADLLRRLSSEEASMQTQAQFT